MDLAVLDLWLDSMILRVFSNLYNFRFPSLEGKLLFHFLFWICKYFFFSWTTGIC